MAGPVIMVRKLINQPFHRFCGFCGFWGYPGLALLLPSLAQNWCDKGWCVNLLLFELFPIVVNLVLWGEDLVNKKVCFWTDNLGVVHCVNKLSPSSLLVLCLLRHLVLRCLMFNTLFRSRHIPDVETVWLMRCLAFSFRCSAMCPETDLVGSQRSYGSW